MTRHSASLWKDCHRARPYSAAMRLAERRDASAPKSVFSVARVQQAGPSPRGRAIRATSAPACPTGLHYPRLTCTFRRAGSNSSEINRMLGSDTEAGMPAQLVRTTRWLQPSSAQ